MTQKETHDVVIFGTGLAECMVAYEMAKEGKKVFVIDTHEIYGEDFSTLKYEDLTKSDLFNVHKVISEDTKLMDNSNQFNIDLIPKLLLMESDLKNVFLKDQIDQIIGFSPIVGSFLYSNKLHTIPKNEKQAMSSGAVSGFIQKTKVARFFYNLRNVDKLGYAYKSTMKQEFDMFGLDSTSIDFIGHAIALHLNNNYLKEHPKKTYDHILRFIQSVVSYDNSESPFIYPQYGLSDICQAYVRKAACLNSIFMLNAKNIKIDLEKKEVAVTDPNEEDLLISYTDIVLNPNYLNFISSQTQEVKVYKEIIRCILVCKKNKKYDGSRNITFLHNNFMRQNDVFGVVLDSKSMACPKEYEICILSTVKETNDIEEELKVFMNKFEVIEYYIGTRNILNNENKNVLCTRSIDESVLMENIYEDVKRILKELKK